MILAALAIHLITSKDEAWSQPNEPYHIAGNIYQVGTKGIGVYLITSPKGHIVLDASTEKGVEVVEANIRSLGFKLSDVKYLIVTHAHFDHIGGMARLKVDTHAKLVSISTERYTLEHGDMDSDHKEPIRGFPPVKVDRIINNGGTIQLGGVELTVHATPGHTKGDMTWTMVTHDPKIRDGKPLRVLFYGSTSVAGNLLVGNKRYPNIVSEYRKAFTVLRSLKADIFLTNHPEFADLAEKRMAQLAGKVDAYVNPTEFANFVNDSASAFEKELVEQRKKAKGKSKT